MRMKGTSMRMMVRYTLPHEPFNSAVRDGSVGAKMKKILDEQKPRPPTSWRTTVAAALS
jgi:hypothetical protein